MSFVLRHTVVADDTAIAVGSGDVPVLGTPRLLALAEAAAVAAISDEVGDAQTSVGTRANVEHLVATPIGRAIEVAAQLVHRDGRLLRFEIIVSEVTDAGEPGRVVGRVELTRVIVDRERFLDQVTRQSPV